MNLKLSTFGLFFLLIYPLTLKAQLSPGPLAEPHAHLSGFTNCLTCHTWGSKYLSPKCLECHTPIQTRIADELGFHGNLEENECLACHSDHMDRNFEMIHWEPSQKDFDHLQTGYELEGKHLKLNCNECHQSEFIVSDDILEYAKSQKASDVLSSTFLGLGTECANCHVEVHANEFVDQTCDDCHNENNWTDARNDYDHDFETNFPLRGAHKQLECEKCHTASQDVVGEFHAQQFTGLEYNLCTNCHRDEHKGSFGSNCLKCHTESTFKQADVAGAFNHQVTRYPLVGKHVSIDCELCHTRKDRFKLASSFDQCSDCHADNHDGIFKKPDRDNPCDQCHSIRGFFPPLFGVIEHRNTRFAIDGAHLAQPCIFCHEQNDEPVYRWEPLSCQSCHTTIHGDQFSRYQQNGTWCENCHKTSDWVDLSFDHNSTFFPLTGKHEDLDCSACHKSNVEITQYEDTDYSCNECHRDVHSKQFEDEICEDCHSTHNWQIPEFDHDSLTAFPLDGQHQDLACGQCHKFELQLNTIRFKPIPHKCQDCHSFGDFKR